MAPPTQDPQRLRRRRIQAGLNQRELAKAAGIHPSHMSWIERGLRGASPRVLARIAAALGCEIADLLPSDADPAPDPQAGAA